MYPLQRSCDLENQIPSFRSSLVPRQPDQILNDPPIPIPIPRSVPVPMPMSSTGKNLPLNTSTTRVISGNDHHLGKQMRSSAETNKQDDDQATTSTKQKRIMHRDIERQRRQEMATLYASLRSLLPLEYIKGKRAISDHMQEAINYIKCLQTNLSQLRDRRDNLVKMSNLSSGNVGNVATCCFPVCTNISVNPCSDGGVEVLICSRPKDEVFPLSRLLKLLISQGLNVVCCVSTTVGEMKVHKIRSEVSDDDETSIDPLALQQKLRDLIDPNSTSQ